MTKTDEEIFCPDHKGNRPRKVIKFDPRNRFAEDILSRAKAQTIRSKPVEVGTKVALWELWRGMKKGCYCDVCWEELDQPEYMAHERKGICWVPKRGKEGIPCNLRRFPRHLLNTTIKECVPIEMKWEPKAFVGTEDEVGEYLMVRSDCLEHGNLGVPPNPVQCDFVKADTPSWTNKQFIDFFRKTYPDIEKGWVPFWIWRWGP